MTRTRTFTTLALTAALSPLLAACSDDTTSAPPAPSPTTSAATSAAPSPTPTPDLSVAPPGETAQEFIKRYYALINEAQRTGDVEAFLAISGPDCDSCQNFAREVRKLYRAGGEIRGGEDTVTALRAESKTEWVVTLDATPTRYEERAGGPTKSYPGGRHKSRVVIADVDGRWIIGFTESLA